MGHSEHVPGRMQQQNLGFSKNKISTPHNRMEPDGEKITKSQMASQKRCFQILDLSSAIIVGEARGNEEDQRSSSADWRSVPERALRASGSSMLVRTVGCYWRNVVERPIRTDDRALLQIPKYIIHCYLLLVSHFHCHENWQRCAQMRTFLRLWLITPKVETLLAHSHCSR